MNRSTFALALAALLAPSLARAETRVVHGDPSKLPPPDLSRQIERKPVEDLQKSFDAKSVNVGSVETRAWTGGGSSVPVKAWARPSGDYYARSIRVEAIEPRGVPPAGWLTKGEAFNRGSVPTRASPLEEREGAARPGAVAAEAVEVPPDLTHDDARRKFRVTTPLVEVDSSGRKRERGQATMEREVAPVSVGGPGTGGFRGQPGKPPPQTPAASR